MSIKVICLCTVGNGNGGVDSAAQAFLDALRGEDVRASHDIPVAESSRELSQANRHDSIDWFGEIVSHQFRRLPISPPFSLIPVPTFNATIESSAGSWTGVLAFSVAAHFEDATVQDVLRWKEDWSEEPAGRHRAEEMYENLVIAGRFLHRDPVILVDHVLTDGRVLRASAARLRRAGARVTLAVCAGRRVRQVVSEPFTAVGGELPDIEL